MSLGKMYFRTALNCWYVNEKTDSGSRQHRLSPNENEARERYKLLAAEKGSSVQNPTVSDAVSLYLAWVEKNRSPDTADKKRRTLDKLVAQLGSTRADDLSPQAVLQWVSKTFPACNGTTIHDRITMVQTCWRWLEDSGHIRKSLIKRVPKPSPTGREWFLPSGRWPELLNGAGESAVPLLKLMLYSGCRPQEAIRLECQHWTGTHFALPPSKSKGKRQGRAIYVPDWLLAEIDTLVKTRHAGKVYLNKAGKPWNKNSLNCLFRRLKKKMDTPELCAYSLRHSFAADKIKKGVPIEIVAKLLGHTNSQMVYSRYGHLAAQVERLTSAVNI